MKAQVNIGFVVAMVLAAACGSSGFPTKNSFGRSIEFVMAGASGTKDARLPFSAEKPASTTFDLIARKGDGSVDTSFTGWLRVSIKPGAVDEVTGPSAETTSGRNVRVVAGMAKQITVKYRGAFGDVALLVSDLGYDKSLVDSPNPACSDGQDNNGNGLIDFPAEPGCEAANDETETGGTYAVWASPLLRYAYPRISDVRGRERSGASTPLKFQQVQLDTGYSPASKSYAFKLVVTRIAANGFYVTDLDETRGYSSVFFYNFTSPPGMRVCDRIRAISGTATEFFGSVQMSFPSWQLEEWQPPSIRDTNGNIVPNPKGWVCEEPEPQRLIPEVISVPKSMLSLVHALVTADTGTYKDSAEVERTTAVYISSAFGPEFPKVNPKYDGKKVTSANPRYLMTENATNCDFNNNGSVDFTEQTEAGCSASCDVLSKLVPDPAKPSSLISIPGSSDCTEYSNFVARKTFRVVVTSKTAAGVLTGDTVQADLSTVAQADPLSLRGKAIQTLRGTLNYFSGGSQFTIQARCSDDFVTAGSTAKPISTACIFPRTEKELEETN